MLTECYKFECKVSFLIEKWKNIRKLRSLDKNQIKTFIQLFLMILIIAKHYQQIQKIFAMRPIFTLLFFDRIFILLLLFQNYKYKMKTKILIFIMLACWATSANQYCQADPLGDLIVIGSASFYNNYQGPRQRCFDIPADAITRSKNAQAVAVPSNIEGYTTNSGLDYSVQIGPSDKGMSLVLMISNDYSWKKIDITYMITARTDLWIGSYVASTFPFIGCWRNGYRSSILQSSIPSLAVARVAKTGAVAFISGVRTESRGFTVDIKSVDVDERLGLLSVEISTNAAVEFIQVSFIIYDITCSLEATIFNYVGIEVLASRQYGFSGIGSCGNNGVILNHIGFGYKKIECRGAGCPSGCVSVENCRKLGGQVTNVCTICRAGEIISANGDCIRPCGANQIYQQGSCVCDKGFLQYEKRCLKQCAPNAVTLDQKCTCIPGFYVVNSKCVPTPVCAENQYFDGKGCACLATCIRNKNGRCVIRKPCQQNEYLNDNNDCECLSTCWRDVYNRCQPKPNCNENEEHDGKGGCACIAGTWRNNLGRCVPRKTCRQFEELNTYGECVCISTCFKNQYGDCQPRPTCRENEVPDGRGGCDCIDGYFRNAQGFCVRKPACRENEYANERNECICVPGCGRNQYGYCVVMPACPADKVVNAAGQCVCADGFVEVAGVCRKRCEDYGYTNGQICTCLPGYTRPQTWQKCQPITRCTLPYEILSGVNTCICQPGYKRVGKFCQKIVCHDPNQVIVDDSCRCKPNCNRGPTGRCEPINDGGVRPVCPARSAWNQNKLKCECTVNGEYLIKNECRPCGAYEGWNGQQCVCSTGYFKIDGVCRTCDLNTYYDGRDCVCNIGFYGNRDKCNKCHDSCGKCSGPNFNQCLTCSDVSYTFKDGCCSRGSACPTGLYYFSETRQCEPCSAYCATCQSEDKCDKCIAGFERVADAVGGVAYCAEICGDGKRFEFQCDDGNTRDGDGCNSKCEQEKGWTCSGGTSVARSNCMKSTQQSASIIIKGAANLFGRVVQGVRMSYLPPAIADNEGVLCHKVLLVKVIKSSVVPGVRVSFIPKSRFQFLVEFDFNGLFAIPVFHFSVQINPEMREYFTAEDMAQIQIVNVDPALLAKPSNDVQQLQLEDIDPNHIEVPADVMGLLGVEDGQK